MCLFRVDEIKTQQLERQAERVGRQAEKEDGEGGWGKGSRKTLWAKMEAKQTGEV